MPMQATTTTPLFSANLTPHRSLNQRQLALLSQMAKLANTGGVQMIVATHSPIIMAYPNAMIYMLTDDGIRETTYEETEHYTVTKEFLNHPEKMLRYLLSGEEE